jgi:predicted nucleic acid-binding Zn ribbon protein
MSLSTWEQQALDSIKGELTDSDPRLVTLLITFNRLASGEAMPVRGKLRAGTRRVIPFSLHRQRRCCRTGLCRNSARRRRHFRLQHALILAWLVITVALIAMTFVLSRGGGGHPTTTTLTCTGTWPVACSHPAPG